MFKEYSNIAVAIDLVKDAYGLTNSLEIQQKIEKIYNVEIHINEIYEYLNNNIEDYELENRKIEYDYIDKY